MPLHIYKRKSLEEYFFVNLCLPMTQVDPLLTKTAPPKVPAEHCVIVLSVNVHISVTHVRVCVRTRVCVCVCVRESECVCVCVCV